MRRARIKALATVPVRKKVVENTTPSVENTDNTPDSEHIEQDTPNISIISEQKNSVQGSGVSASESEDEHGKRATSVVPSRIRNDSICSVQSNKESTINDTAKIKVMQKKRTMVSESARKLAEARREFLLKHENKTPDRSQLKMYDLIYYNPVTNPMKKSKTPTIVPRNITTTETEEILKDEREDDPSAMPAPQVKVGPDGQLILDEQSLVIEQTAVKKNREILSQEAIVEDDDCGGGFYKKRQKSKEWPKWETFQFYKALNVVGTDFLLMQTLFPNRTRQEIKQKFKKEERVNRSLVEKTLKYHQEFNTETLQKDLAALELENIQADMDKKTSEKDKNDQHMTKRAKKRRRRFAATSIAECEASSTNNQEAEDKTTIDQTDVNSGEVNKVNEINEVNSSEVNEVSEINEINSGQHQPTRKGNKRKLKKYSVDNFDDSSCTSSNDDSDSDMEVYQVRPTRSGRQPRPKVLQARNFNTLDSSIENESLVKSESMTSLQEILLSREVTNDTSSKDNADATSENITTVIPDINKIEPGSLVILTKESVEEPGKTILQVYMVSSNVDKNNVDGETIKSNMTPVVLPPELLSTVTNKMEDVEPVNVVDDCE